MIRIQQQQKKKYFLNNAIFYLPRSLKYYLTIILIK